MNRLVLAWLTEESESIKFVGKDTSTGYLTSKIIVSGTFTLHSGMVLIIDLGMECGGVSPKCSKVNLRTKDDTLVPAETYFEFVGKRARLTINVNTLEGNFPCDELHVQLPNELSLVLSKELPVNECDLTLNDLMDKHPYHSAAGFDEIWPDLDSFLDEFKDVDIDWNLVVRWDVNNSETSNTGYDATIAMFQQRKESIVFHRIENLKESDVDALVNYLTPYWERNKENWAPLNK